MAIGHPRETVMRAIAQRIWQPTLIVAIGLALLFIRPGVPWLEALSSSDGSTGDPSNGVGVATHGLKLLAAALIGVSITLVQRRSRVNHVAPASIEAMEQAQVLLAMAGALMMMLVGNSLAHAFGIAGAASIVRFRTPVDDPRDVTVLFMLMGLGMAAGMGAFEMAGVGALFLAIVLLSLHRLEVKDGRAVKVRLVASGAAFPLAHVHEVFTHHHIPIEPLEVTAGTETAMRFRGRFATDEGLDSQLETISHQLLADGGLKEVSWEPAKVH
jgi:hypothetical protein